MPDAREMLKNLAKNKRHKGVEIKVPPSPSKPIGPKKIQRKGATRPYHQQLSEVPPSDSIIKQEDADILRESSANTQDEDQKSNSKHGRSTSEKLETDKDCHDSASESFENLGVEKNTQEKHTSTDNRLAENQLTDIQLSENQQADIRLADNRKAELSDTKDYELAHDLSKDLEVAPHSEANGEVNQVQESLLGEITLGTESPPPESPASAIDSEIHFSPLSQDDCPTLDDLIESLHESTDFKLSENRLSESDEAKPLSERMGATASAPSEISTSALDSHIKPRRSGGKTVSNLLKRSLIRPDWEPDFSRDESFLREYFRKLLGKGKYMKEVDLYCQLYSLAKAKNSITLHFLSAQIGEMVGSSSNGTIRTRLITGEEIGLFVQQGFNNETLEHRRGTYIHLRFPWR